MQNVTIINHPFAQDALTHLRDKSTSTQDFRIYAEKISSILIFEASRDLATRKKSIETPLEKMDGEVIAAQVVIATIFRAGLAMLGPAVTLFPSTPVGFIGLERDEKTAVAKEYYWKMPEITNDSIVLLLDPMLATGGSLIHVLEKIKEAKEIRIVTIISAPEGIRAVNNAFPNVRIVTGAIDKKLNDKKFIVPGLGDFGDRYFGTE